MWKQEPIYGHFLSVGWGGFSSSFDENVVSFLYTTDEVTDRVKGDEEERTQGKKGVAFVKSE